ncbi:MAG: pyridoxamine 5'-phosphate oxidase family protein [Candidatus Zapsychrus exili]|nr:pyridoxamine 5'-phosphate oxidase family protein [Candidatus Zapsychrus exili]
MKDKLSRDQMNLLQRQGFVMVATLDSRNKINCSAKGIVGIEEDKVFIIDLYKGNTYKNLARNSTVSIDAIDEHSFSGVTIQGKAKIVLREKIEDHIIKKWENSIIRRISSRVIKSVQTSVKSRKHFEVDLPKHPKYLIEIDVEKVIDLSPIKKK